MTCPYLGSAQKKAERDPLKKSILTVATMSSQNAGLALYLHGFRWSLKTGRVL